MNFTDTFEQSRALLMEGSLGLRLRKEYQMSFDEQVAMAGLVYDLQGRKYLSKIMKEYMEVAKKYQLPFIATTPTRRANQERVEASKFHKEILQANVDFFQKLKADTQMDQMFIGGLMGCKGDAYSAKEALGIQEAQEFHSWQANLFKEAKVDFLLACIMPVLTEAIGMAKAMEQTSLPYIISFMIRKNGKLLDGTTIHDAITVIDQSTDRKPLCYMTNCVHPLVVKEALSYEFNQTATVKQRFRGIQANTSALAPEELDGIAELKSSTAEELAEGILALKEIMQIKLYGGCCGTNASHLDAIGRIAAGGN